MHKLGWVLLVGGCLPYIAEVVPAEVDEPDVVEPDVPNEVPVANAGPDQRVPVGTPVVLNGGSSHDPDSNELSYEWEVLEAPAGSRASVRSRGDSAAFDPDVVGDFRIRLTVTDGDGASDSDSVDVESVDTWGDDGGRPAPGEVYLLGQIDGDCRRGVTALRPGSPALVGFDCAPELESVMVQIDGSFWWVDGATPLQHVCDGRCWIDQRSQYPRGDVAGNDIRLDVPCAEEAVEVVLGPDRTLARCFSNQGEWVDDDGVVMSAATWVPFAAGHDGLVLVRRRTGRDIGVLDPATGEIQPTSPALDWHFLRSWRAFEDGFRVAAFDNRNRTTLVEVDADGAVTLVGTYPQLPVGTVVRVGSRLDSAGNLYMPVVDGQISKVLRTEPDGELQTVWNDATGPLVHVGFGGELVTGP